MDVDCDGPSSARRRRRERRLRSWLRHERMTVAAALAEALHHSSLKVGAAPNNAPRSQKTARAGGEHPGVLKEPEVQLEAATVGLAASTPLLVVASLAGGDDVDATTVSFLLSVALTKKKEEEKEKEEKEKEAEEVKAREERKAMLEEKMLVINRRVRDGTATPAEEAAWRRWMGIAPSSSSSSSGKRKKKRKKKFRSLPLVPLPVMDAPVIINDESQQSKKFEFMVPQTQFIDDVWTFSLCNNKYVVFWYRKLWSFRSCSSSLAVDTTVFTQKLIPMVQTAQQIMEILQLLLFLVADFSVVRVVQVVDFRCAGV